MNQRYSQIGRFLRHAKVLLTPAYSEEQITSPLRYE